MTTISAKVIADSIGEDAPRLTTLQLRFPRFLLAELNTHRVFSRNARSSRAVPIAKMIEEVESDPVVPLHWGAAQAGMQADRECIAMVCFDVDKCDRVGRRDAWLMARDEAVTVAKAFAEAGYHKQIVNRLIEPFLHVDVLLSSTEWSNFFALRDHHAAEPHIQLLARAIRKAMEESEPERLFGNEWHLPYVRDEDWAADDRRPFDEIIAESRMVSAARCARISYKPFEGGDGSTAADIDLADKLATSGHWSPFEHVAAPDVMGKEGWKHLHHHGNFHAWRQFRHVLEDARRDTPK